MICINCKNIKIPKILFKDKIVDIDNNCFIFMKDEDNLNENYNPIEYLGITLEKYNEIIKYGIKLPSTKELINKNKIYKMNKFMSFDNKLIVNNDIITCSKIKDEYNCIFTTALTTKENEELNYLINNKNYKFPFIYYEVTISSYTDCSIGLIKRSYSRYFDNVCYYKN